MKDDSFILLSLKDGKSKKLAHVMTNDSSRKILDYLGRKEEATESQIAKDLGLPVSTVNYNMKLLVEAGFLTADEYHYSEKGKEVVHYRLANKLIVIAPKTTFGFKQKLRSILPAGMIAGGIAVLLRFFPYLDRRVSGTGEAYVAQEAAPRMMADMEMMALEAPVDTIGEGMHDSLEIANASLFADIALWFFLGVLTTVILILVIDWARSRRS